jgi:ribosome biogenesis GTPase A
LVSEIIIDHTIQKLGVADLKRHVLLNSGFVQRSKMSPAATRGETSSRPSSPHQQDLWSQILDSVSSSRAIPSKNVLVLGEPQTGKSTVANALLQGSHGRVDSKGREREQTTSSDFALGYEWADVRDDADEGNRGWLN